MKRYLWIICPVGTHRKFRIAQRMGSDGKPTYLKDEKLDTINNLYLAGTIDAQVAKAQCNTLVLAWRAEDKPEQIKYLDANLDILDKYLKEEYLSRDIHAESLRTAKNSFKRALGLLNELDIAVAPEKVIQARINGLPFKKRQPIVLSLNCLFKFIGRKHTFEVGKNKDMRKVRHLTLAEFQKVIPNIHNETLRIMAGATFASGCRVGEMFALDKYDELNKILIVPGQVDRNLIERQTKTYQTRTTVVIQELSKYMKEWIDLGEKRLEIRNSRISFSLKEACKKTFPNSKEKWCHFYDLRHSYAIHFLGLGVSLDVLSQVLGNSPEVCRKHYVGFNINENGIAMMNHLQTKKTG